MIKKLMTAVLGTRHARDAKRLQPIVAQIKAHEERLGGLAEEELMAQTARFRGFIAERTGSITVHHAVRHLSIRPRD